jgi:hypothetical protein
MRLQWLVYGMPRLRSRSGAYVKNVVAAARHVTDCRQRRARNMNNNSAQKLMKLVALQKIKRLPNKNLADVAAHFAVDNPATGGRGEFRYCRAHYYVAAQRHSLLCVTELNVHVCIGGVKAACRG